MEAKVSAAISQQLETISGEIEAQQARIARKRLLLDRVCHNWNCRQTSAAVPDSTEEVSGGQTIIREPVMVPLNSPSPIVSHHLLRIPLSLPQSCRAPVQHLRIVQRLYRGRWVIVAEAEMTDRGPAINQLFPVADSDWEDSLIWTTPSASMDSVPVRFVACCPIPEFTSKSSLTVHLFLTDHDIVLPIGSTSLSWEDLLYARVPHVPQCPEEMDCLDESEKSLVTTILNSIQVRTRISVAVGSPLNLVRELEIGLGVTQLEKKSSAWIRRPVGLIGCRLSVREHERSGDVDISLWTNDQQQSAVFVQLLRSKLPEEAKVSTHSTDAEPEQSLESIRSLVVAEVEALHSLYTREVDALLDEIGGPRLIDDMSSPSKIVTILSQLKKAQNTGQKKLPRSVRERLKNEAKAIREKFDGSHGDSS